MGEIGPYIQRLCPSTCGLCEKGTNGTVNPLNPDTYRITAVHYHAHLLGREMYTTLIPADEDNDNHEEQESSSTTTAAVAASAKQASVVPKDLQSREFWIFDNQ